MALAVLTLLAIIIQFLGEVFAQITTNAICQPSYSWMSNSLGQNPCLVTAYVEGVCNNGQWNVPKLPLGEVYLPPNAAQSTNPCLCSTVSYSLLAACSICQGLDFLRWSYYSSNCTGPLLGKFVEPIPPQTAVPAWAYLDGMSLCLGPASNAPESTAFVPTSTSSTSSSFSTSTTASTTSTSPVSSSSAPSSVSKTPSNAGAIAGGVVGGES
ncbi:hypothetical protein PILCRDRAFT_4486 [Piloderma croceum F 1598]|uniref:Uncharacterized protein n=1 Tax=Piloderma croceum (strain F 1598) TaxID=765440 RepID=A0A0C3G3S9_PILCF|nr:hypothetical protein PILCRDRAFT_4486 [Piloderma croceum F 1598]